MVLYINKTFFFFFLNYIFCAFTCSQLDVFQGCVLVLVNPLSIALEEDLQRRSSPAFKLNWIAFDDVRVIRLLKEARQGSG